jgi:hypothetical protein
MCTDQLFSPKSAKITLPPRIMPLSFSSKNSQLIASYNTNAVADEKQTTVKSCHLLAIFKGKEKNYKNLSKKCPS